MHIRQSLACTSFVGLACLSPRKHSNHCFLPTRPPPASSSPLFLIRRALGKSPLASLLNLSCSIYHGAALMPIPPSGEAARPSELMMRQPLCLNALGTCTFQAASPPRSGVTRSDHQGIRFSVFLILREWILSRNGILHSQGVQ